MAETTMPLLDAVKAGSAALATPSAGGPGQLSSPVAAGITAGENTEQAAKLVGTAQTGKEFAPGASGMARLSAVGERIAAMSTLMSGQALQQQGALQSAAQAQQAAATQQQFAQQTAQLDQKTLDMRVDFTNKLNGVVQQSEEELQHLTLADNRSKAEQVGTMLRLSNDQYMTALNDRASRARLDNAASFKASLASTVFAQETQLLGNNLQFRNILQQSHRDALDSIASMDLDFALGMATAQWKGEAGAQMWSGVGTAGSVLAGAAVSQASKPAEQADTGESQSITSMDTGSTPEGNLGGAESTLGGGGQAVG